MQEISYIGLDISTSIIGVCFLDSNSELVLLDNINLKKTKSIFSKSEIVKHRLIEYKNSLKFTKNIKISIEEAFQSFRTGFSSAKTLSQLNRFNGIVSYLVYDIFNIEPLYINVNSARKNLQIKIDRKSKKSTKEQVFEWAKININSEFKWPEKVLKSGPNKGRVKFDESCYDMSDAFVICKALIFNEESNNK